MLLRFPNKRKSLDCLRKVVKLYNAQLGLDFSKIYFMVYSLIYFYYLCKSNSNKK